MCCPSINCRHAWIPGSENSEAEVGIKMNQASEGLLSKSSAACRTRSCAWHSGPKTSEPSRSGHAGQPSLSLLVGSRAINSVPPTSCSRWQLHCAGCMCLSVVKWLNLMPSSVSGSYSLWLCLHQTHMKPLSKQVSRVPSHSSACHCKAVE